MSKKQKSIMITTSIFILVVVVTLYTSQMLMNRNEPCLASNNDINWKHIQNLEMMESCFSDFVSNFPNLEALRGWLNNQGFTKVDVHTISENRMKRFGEKEAGSLLSASWARKVKPFPFPFFPFRPIQSIGAYGFSVSLTLSQSNQLLETDVSFSYL